MLPDEENPSRPKRKPRPKRPPKPVAEAAQVVEPVVEPAEPAQVAPLAEESFSAQLQRLTEHAKSAWLNPLHTMAQTYVEKGRAVIEGLLGALENETSSKKKD